jgi:hypothetical protein
MLTAMCGVMSSQFRSRSRPNEAGVQWRVRATVDQVQRRRISADAAWEASAGGWRNVETRRPEGAGPSVTDAGRKSHSAGQTRAMKAVFMDYVWTASDMLVLDMWSETKAA